MLNVLVVNLLAFFAIPSVRSIPGIRPVLGSDIDSLFRYLRSTLADMTSKRHTQCNATSLLRASLPRWPRVDVSLMVVLKTDIARSVLRTNTATCKRVYTECVSTLRSCTAHHSLFLLSLPSLAPSPSVCPTFQPPLVVSARLSVRHFLLYPS